MNNSEIMYYARGIGISLVVWAHVFSGSWKSAIYMFHMPFFFIVAGISARSFNGSGRGIFKLVQSIIVPVVFAYFVIYSFGFLFGKCGYDAVFNFWRANECGVSFYGEASFSGATSPFWFLISLFFVYVLFEKTNFYVTNKKMLYVAIFFGASVSFFISYINFIPKTLLATFFSYQFFLIGYVYKFEKIKLNIALVVLIFSANYFLTDYLSLDIAAKDFGYPFISAFCAAAVSAALISGIEFFYSLKSTVFKTLAKTFCLIGRMSLFILLWHQSIHLVVLNLFPGCNLWVVYFISVFAPIVVGLIWGYVIRCLNDFLRTGVFHF